MIRVCFVANGKQKFVLIHSGHTFAQILPYLQVGQPSIHETVGYYQG